ncbi:sensor histidine kinase [Nitrospira lenta]|nr:sensor histidine kinase [Nitrospira lenta]
MAGYIRSDSRSEWKEGAVTTQKHTTQARGPIIDAVTLDSRSVDPGHDQNRLDRSREELRMLTGKLLTVQDEERRRISRDLHDDVNQRLGAIGLQLDSLCRHLPASSTLIRRRIGAIRRHVSRLSDDVRQLAYRFHETTVEDLGLAVALQRYLHDFVKRTGIKAKFIKPHSAMPIPPQLATCLYRIAQESLGNVGLHAQASQVTIQLALLPDAVSLTIRDNGVGMNPDDVQSRTGGLGILSMQERARLLNGSVEWHSTTGAGTDVVAHLPYPVEAP